MRTTFRVRREGAASAAAARRLWEADHADFVLHEIDRVADAARDPAALCRRLAAEAAALAADTRAAGRRNAEAGASFALGEVAAQRGDLEAARRHYAHADALREQLGMTLQRLWALLGLVHVAVERGDAAEARRLAGRAVALSARPGGGADVEAELHLALACLAGGDLGAAGAAAARAAASLEDGDVLSLARLRRTEAALAAARGDAATAVALLRRALADLAATDYRLERLRTLVALAPALRRVGHAAEAGEVAAAAAAQATALGAAALLTRLEAGDGG
jgi:ATP/maltotriose-dependent transcriptional regulator MalT